MRRREVRALLLSIAGLGLTAAGAIAGPDWIEQGDAGSSAGTAQVPRRPPQAISLRSITGSLGGDQRGGDFEDLYFIRIEDPVEWVVRPSETSFDAALYLFRYQPDGDEAFGLLGNDNEHVETNVPQLTQFSTDGSEASVSEPGDYILAVTSATRFPFSDTGAICLFETFTEISGPDGPGGNNPLSQWVGDGLGGTYRIEMTAVDFPSVPTPGAALVLAGGPITLLRRRR